MIAAIATEKGERSFRLPVSILLLDLCDFQERLLQSLENMIATIAEHNCPFAYTYIFYCIPMCSFAYIHYFIQLPSDLSVAYAANISEHQIHHIAIVRIESAKTHAKM